MFVFFFPHFLTTPVSLSLAHSPSLSFSRSHLVRRKHEGKEEHLPAVTKVKWKFPLNWDLIITERMDGQEGKYQFNSLPW